MVNYFHNFIILAALIYLVRPEENVSFDQSDDGSVEEDKADIEATTTEVFANATTNLVLPLNSTDAQEPRVTMKPLKKNPMPSICYKCQCLDTVPFDINCETLELTEYPEELASVNLDRHWMLSFRANMFTALTKLPPLKNLISLSFSRNKINWIENGTFSELPDLQKLDLSHNNLSKESLLQTSFIGEYQKEFAGARYPLPIQILDLSYNKIHSLEHHTFRHLAPLRSLFLNNNPIQDISMDMAQALMELSSLKNLDLSETGLQRIPQFSLSELEHLETLTLSGNAFPSIPEEVNFTKKLRGLNLNANPIKSLQLGDLGVNLGTLEELSLSAMPVLEYVESESFSFLRSLKVLRMSDSPNFDRIHKDAFLGLVDNGFSLREVHFQNNALQTLDSDLLPWLDLDVVDLQNNPWLCDCHLEWVYKNLLPHIVDNTPQLALSLMCAEPLWAQGLSVDEVGTYSSAFECHPHEAQPSTAGALVFFMIFVGILLFATGSLLFAYILFRRSQVVKIPGQTVKYRRTYNDDEEIFNRSEFGRS